LGAKTWGDGAVCSTNPFPVIVASAVVVVSGPEIRELRNVEDAPTERKADVCPLLRNRGLPPGTE
jgi:hypothetical protein